MGRWVSSKVSIVLERGKCPKWQKKYYVIVVELPLMVACEYFLYAVVQVSAMYARIPEPDNSFLPELLLHYFHFLQIAKLHSVSQIYSNIRIFCTKY